MIVARRSTPVPVAATVGFHLDTPIVLGECLPAIHLDHAASTPALQSAVDAVTELLPWYASVHRGAGFASTVSSERLEDARGTIARFVGARDDDVTVLVRNTTDALNLLAGAVPEGTVVVTLDIEHHANLLPWRRGDVVHLAPPVHAADVPAVFDTALRQLDGRTVLVAVTGASNVTGELLPIGELARVTRRHGARIVVDAAQLVAHRPVDIAALDVDYIAFSGHKLYAPFGAGALVGRRDWLDAAAPLLAGGGAVHVVTSTDQRWAPAPARHEGGTPNVIGAIAIAAAIDALTAIGWDAVRAHDDALTAGLDAGLASLQGVEVLRGFADAERVPIASLRLPVAPALVAAALSAEHAIATRDGAFCAHPFLRRLHDAKDHESVPNALRVSAGLGTSVDDIARFVSALGQVLADGPAWSYVERDGRVVPDPDPRPRPGQRALIGA